MPAGSRRTADGTDRPPPVLVGTTRWGMVRTEISGRSRPAGRPAACLETHSARAAGRPFDASRAQSRMGSGEVGQFTGRIRWPPPRDDRRDAHQIIGDERVDRGSGRAATIARAPGARAGPITVGHRGSRRRRVREQARPQLPVVGHLVEPPTGLRRDAFAAARPRRPGRKASGRQEQAECSGEAGVRWSRRRLCHRKFRRRKSH